MACAGVQRDIRVHSTDFAIDILASMAERLNDDSLTDGTKLQYLGEDVVLSKSITECGISSGAVIFAVRSNDLLPEVILTPRTSEVYTSTSN